MRIIKTTLAVASLLAMESIQYDLSKNKTITHEPVKHHDSPDDAIYKDIEKDIPKNFDEKMET